MCQSRSKAGTSYPIGDEVEDGVRTDIKENEVRLWSNGQNTEAPKELETPEPSPFGPVLQCMEISYEEARAEYLKIVDSDVSKMLKDSKRFKDMFNSELALCRFVPVKWDGIKGFYRLDLVVREDSPRSYKIRARPIHPL